MLLRNTVDSLQKLVDQMEQDQAVMAKKVQRLQESVKNQKKVLFVLLLLCIVYMLYYHYVLL